MDQSNFYTNEGSRNPRHQLTMDERGMMQALHEQGYSLRDIADSIWLFIHKQFMKFMSLSGAK